MYTYFFNALKKKKSQSDKDVHIISDVLKSCVALNNTYIFKKTTVAFFALQNSLMPNIGVNFLHFEIYLIEPSQFHSKTKHKIQNALVSFALISLALIS